MSVHPIGPRAYDPGYSPNAKKTSTQNARPVSDLARSLSQEETSAIEKAFGLKTHSMTKHVTESKKALGQNVDISA